MVVPANSPQVSDAEPSRAGRNHRRPESTSEAPYALTAADLPQPPDNAVWTFAGLRTRLANRHPILVSVLALILATFFMVLTGCSSEPGNPGWFPLNPGWTWTYRLTTTTDQGSKQETFTVTNVGLRAFDDAPTATERRNSFGTRTFIVSDAAGIYRVASQNEAEYEPTLDESADRTWVVRAPIKVGTVWQARTRPYLLTRAMDWPYELKYGKPVVMQYEIASLTETVQVPAGTFTGVMHIVGEHTMKLYTDPVSGWADVPVITNEWYAPGVGMIKLTREEKVAPSKYYRGGTISFELESLKR